MRRMALIGVAAASMALLLWGCGGDGKAARGDGRMQVVASFYPLAEAAGRIGGERVRITNLTPAGAEPHDMELTSRQVDLVEDADLVIYLGQGFQPSLEKVVARRGGTSLDVLDAVTLEEGAIEALEQEEHGEQEGEGAADGHDEGRFDPHFWLDPRLLVAAVEALADTMAAVSPSDAEVFGANAGRYVDQLRTLDGDMERGLASCARKEIVTSHAAFHYLARRYGLTQLPISGLSPEAEPDPRRLAELTDQIRARGITTVFSEVLASPEVARTLASEAGVTTAVLNPIEGLTRDQLAAGGDYAAVMRENLAALRGALGCS